MITSGAHFTETSSEKKLYESIPIPEYYSTQVHSNFGQVVLDTRKLVGGQLLLILGITEGNLPREKEHIYQ